MPTCFVIQPFDRAKFDKRYEDTFAPAIREAGLEPYRVDQDPGVEIPIEAIEQGIRDAAICLADITTDNPNVWYELGVRHALRARGVILIQSERDHQPFDVYTDRKIRYHEKNGPQKGRA